MKRQLLARFILLAMGIAPFAIFAAIMGTFYWFLFDRAFHGTQTGRMLAWMLLTVYLFLPVGGAILFGIKDWAERNQ